MALDGLQPAVTLLPENDTGVTETITDPPFTFTLNEASRTCSATLMLGPSAQTDEVISTARTSTAADVEVTTFIAADDTLPNDATIELVDPTDPA